MSPHDPSDWMPCSEGALRSTIELVRYKKRKANALGLFSVAVVSAIAVGIFSFYNSTVPSSLDCHGVSGLLAGYVAGDLDGESVLRVEQHLASCAKCRIKLQGLQSNESQSKGGFVSRHQSMANTKIEPWVQEPIGSEFLLNTIHAIPLSID